MKGEKNPIWNGKVNLIRYKDNVPNSDYIDYKRKVHKYTGRTITTMLKPQGLVPDNVGRHSDQYQCDHIIPIKQGFDEGICPELLSQPANLQYILGKTTDANGTNINRVISNTPYWRNVKMAYSKLVEDHYYNPRNVGKWDPETDGVGTGMVGAPSCGDVMRLQIKVDEDGVIQDAKFKTYGCGSAIASSSLLTEMVKGMTLDQATQIKNTELAQELSLPPVKIHCSVLAEDAIKAAVRDYRERYSAESKQ